MLITSGRIGGKIILVKVGPKETEFNVYQDLICASSDFFRTMMASGMEESKTGIVKLPEDHPVLFDIYHQWLFTSKILMPFTTGADSTRRRQWDILTDAYELGGKFQDALFQDFVMETFIRLPDELINGGEAVSYTHLTLPTKRIV